VSRHFGGLPSCPSARSGALDASAGREVSVVIHNNSSGDRNFKAEVKGEGWILAGSRRYLDRRGMEREVLFSRFSDTGANTVDAMAAAHFRLPPNWICRCALRDSAR